jgi:uncharacterized protein (DUF885 family)
VDQDSSSSTQIIIVTLLVAALCVITLFFLYKFISKMDEVLESLKDVKKNLTTIDSRVYRASEDVSKKVEQHLNEMLEALKEGSELSNKIIKDGNAENVASLEKNIKSLLDELRSDSARQEKLFISLNDKLLQFKTELENLSSTNKLLNSSLTDSSDKLIKVLQEATRI